MSFSRFLYILGHGPRIIRLLTEVWAILTGSTEERIALYLADVETITGKLKGAKTNEEREDVASRISDFVREL